MSAFVVIVLGVPVGVVFCGALVTLARERSIWTVLEVAGSGGFVVVVLAHIAEAFQLLPWMGWGQPHSAGHYLDLSGAVAGVALFPLGYLVRTLRR